MDKATLILSLIGSVRPLVAGIKTRVARPIGVHVSYHWHEASGVSVGHGCLAGQAAGPSAGDWPPF